MGSTNKKIEKQAVIEEQFSMENISKATKVFRGLKSQSIQYNTIRFLVHKDYIQKFNELRISYDEVQKLFISKNHFFGVMIEFLKTKYEKEKIYKKASAEFIEAVTKRGKRKKNTRTYSTELLDSLTIKASLNISDDYLDLMYSFILNKKGESIYNDYHSRTYFFYDLLDLIEKNKTSFIKFKNV